MRAIKPNRTVIEASAREAYQAVDTIQRWVWKSYGVDPSQLNAARATSLPAIAAVVKRSDYLGHDVAKAPSKALKALRDYLACLPHYDNSARAHRQTLAATKFHNEQFSAVRRSLEG